MDERSSGYTCIASKWVEREFIVGDYTWIFEHCRKSIAPLSVDLTSSRSLRKVTPEFLDWLSFRYPNIWITTTHRSRVAKNRYRTHRPASRWSMDRHLSLGKKPHHHVLGLKQPWTSSTWRTTKNQHSVYTDSIWHTHLMIRSVCAMQRTNVETNNSAISNVSLGSNKKLRENIPGGY